MRQVMKGNRMTNVRPLHSTFEADKCDRLKVAKDVESDVFNLFFFPLFSFFLAAK